MENHSTNKLVHKGCKVRNTGCLYNTTIRSHHKKTCRLVKFRKTFYSKWSEKQHLMETICKLNDVPFIIFM